MQKGRVEAVYNQNYGCYMQDLNSTVCRAITRQEESSRSVQKDRIITKVYRQVQELIWTISAEKTRLCLSIMRNGAGGWGQGGVSLFGNIRKCATGEKMPFAFSVMK